MNNNKVIDFDGCWCEATEENYRALANVLEIGIEIPLDKKDKYLIVKHEAIWSSIKNDKPKKGKQIHLVDGEFEYVEEKCKICGEPKDICKNEESCSYKIQSPDKNVDWEKLDELYKKQKCQEYFNKCDNLKDYIEIKGYRFEKPEFKYEIIDNKDAEYLYLWVKTNSGWQVLHYTFNGLAYFGMDKVKKYNLTPLKKPWYEDESNIGKIVIASGGITCSFGKLINKNEASAVDLDTGEIIIRPVSNFRPATKEETLSLLVKE